MIFLIAYDLEDEKGSDDSEKLLEAIEGEFKDSVRVVKTTWLVDERGQTAKSIRKRFFEIPDPDDKRRNLVDCNDRVIVVKFKHVIISHMNLLEGAADWIRRKRSYIARLRARLSED